MKDIDRLTFPSIPLIHHPVDEALEIISDAGYKNVDIIDKPPHWSVFPDECDHEKLKETAEEKGLRITMVNGYFGGGAAGRESAWKHHPGFKFPN